MNSLRTLFHGLVLAAVVGVGSVSAQHMVHHIAKDVTRNGLSFLSYTVPSFIELDKENFSKAPLFGAAMAATTIACLQESCGAGNDGMKVLAVLAAYGATNYGLRRLEDTMIKSEAAQKIKTQLTVRGFLKRNEESELKKTEAIVVGSAGFTKAVQNVLSQLQCVWHIGMKNIMYAAISKQVALASVLAFFSVINK